MRVKQIKAVILFLYKNMRYKNIENFKHEFLKFWAKDKYKKSTAGALNSYKKHSQAGKKKAKPVFFRLTLENLTHLQT